VLQIFIEQGESAKTTQRTELQKLLSFCTNRKNEVGYVIAYKLDRVARNFDDYSHIRILLKRHNVEIKSTTEYFEDSPAGRFMENIIANVAQFDNDVRAERSIGGMKEAMREGRYVWMAPIGYVNAKVGGKTTIVKSENAPLIYELFSLMAQNRCPVSEARSHITKKGLTSVTGKKLSLSQYYRILRNKAYAGWICKFDECHRGLFEPIVSDEMFEQVQRVLKRHKGQGKTYQIEREDFPLRRFLRHPNGLLLTGSWVQGKCKKYPYYNYHLKGHYFPKKQLEDRFRALLDSYALPVEYFRKLKVYLQKHFGKKTERKGKQLALCKRGIEELKARQQLLIDKNLQGTINDKILKQQLDTIEEELMKVSATLINIETTSVKYDDLLERAAEYLIAPSKAWEKLSIRLKKKLQVFYFPQGIIFDGKESRTPEICSIFQVKKLFLENFSPKVTPKLTTSNTPELTSVDTSENTLKNKDKTENQGLFWNAIANNLVDLGNLSSEKATESETLEYTDTS